MSCLVSLHFIVYLFAVSSPAHLTPTHLPHICSSPPVCAASVPMLDFEKAIKDGWARQKLFVVCSAQFPSSGSFIFPFPPRRCFQYRALIGFAGFICFGGRQLLLFVDVPHFPNTLWRRPISVRPRGDNYSK